MNRVVLLCVLLTVSCAKPPSSLTDAGARAWQANEAVVALNTLQSAAIGLNQIQVCPPAPCHPLLSEANTRLVGNAATNARNAIDAAPGNWKLTVQAVLTQISTQLDASGKQTLAAYLTATNTVIAALAP